MLCRKMKVLLVFVVVLSCLLMISSSLAASSKYFVYDILEDGTARITGYKSRSSLAALPAGTYYEEGESVERDDFRIPSSLGGRTVSAIGDEAFSYLSGYRRIMIPETIKIIDGNPFIWLGDVEAFEVDQNNSCFFSEDGVLYEKASGRLIVYPIAKDGSEFVVPDFVDSIEKSAFASSKIKSVVIPGNVRKIGENAFNRLGGIGGLESVELNDGLLEIGSRAFYGSSKLKKINIPKTVEKIGENPFIGCYGINISMSEENQAFLLQNKALIRKSDMKLIATSVIRDEEYYIPEGVKTVASYSFTYAYSNKFVFPDSVTTIESNAFDNISNPAEVILPEGLEEIGVNGIRRNDSFPLSFELPENYRNSHPEEWEYACNGFQLKIINWGVTGEAVLEKYTGNMSFLSTAAIRGYIDQPLLIVKTAPGAFENNQYLKMVILDSFVSDIPDRLFANCRNLETVKIIQPFAENKKIEIGHEAFSGCGNLKTIECSFEIVGIADDAFKDAYPEVNWEFGNGINCDYLMRYISSNSHNCYINGILVEKQNALSAEDNNDVILLGKYEQDDNSENGPEPIEWLVLDNRDGETLLITAKSLDIIKFGEYETTWEKSSLREWLNGTFYDNAFTEDEKSMIVLTYVPASTNASTYFSGNDTVDKVFALSVGEVYDYMDGSREKRINVLTDYSKRMALEHGYSEEETGWWSRTSGGTFMTILNTSFGSGWYYSGVRPVIWVKSEVLENR